jgi:hypothetical protein
VGTYATLDEAVERRVITITERGSGEVPAVVIRNTGALPIYISAGEVIIGGKQDRMVAYDVLIQPGRELTVEVRCVEQGRWQGASRSFGSAGAMGGAKARFSVQFRDQREVWGDVAAQNAAVGAQSPSGSYIAALKDPAVETQYGDYARVVLPSLAGRTVVGTVIAINGKVQAIDIFASPSLFQKMKEKILKAAVLDVTGVKDASAPPPGKDAILSFYKTTMEAQAVDLKGYMDNRNVKRECGAAIANDSIDAEGRVIHKSLMAK